MNIVCIIQNKHYLYFTNGNEASGLNESYMNTPKSLADLKYFQNVFAVDTASVGIQTEAERVFNENFGEDTLPGKVTARYLFTEIDGDGNQVKVYEAYKDSGSEDYIYLTATL